VRDYLDKREEELLVVHPPRPAADRKGREPIAPPEALAADVEGLATRLRSTAGADERAHLLAAIRSRFGNAFASQVMKAYGQGGPNAPASTGDDTTSGDKR
jgi:hypothetical protein